MKLKIYFCIVAFKIFYQQGLTNTYRRLFANTIHQVVISG